MHIDQPDDFAVREPHLHPAGWHIGKEVPLALLVAIAVQTAGIVWYISKLDSRVQILEDARAERNVQLVKIAEDRELTHTRLTTLEIKLEAILEGVRRIETRLDPHMAQ